jgi:hypothetical protein
MLAVMENLSLPSHPLVRRQALACGLLRAVVAVLAITLAGDSIAYGQTAAAPSAPKQSIQELGISKRVKVKELDGATVKGTITAVHEDSFLLIPKSGGPPVAISFSQVATVKRDSMPTALKAVIWTLVIFVAFVFIGSAIYAHETGW